MSEYIDGHCHLADPRIQNEVSRWIEEASRLGIQRFVQGGVGPTDWERQSDLKKSFPGKILTSFGVHPWWVADHSLQELESALELLKKKMLSDEDASDALGELGLDRSQKIPEESWDRQLRAYEFQLELGSSLGKPLVLHVVRAHEEALVRLARLDPQGGKLRGLVHSFSGSSEIARRYLDLGMSLSISGVITREGYETLKRAVSYIPWDRLVVETDSPDQPPKDWPRATNEPSSLIQTADVIGKIRGVEVGKVLETSAENIRRMFLL